MKKEFLILIAAVLMGIAAIVFNQIHRSGVEEELRATISAETKVVRMVARVSPGMILEENYLEPVDIPTVYVHPMAVNWLDRERVVGQEVRVPVNAGQPLLWSDMVDGSTQSVNDLILAGRGVVTLPIAGINAAAGMIQPGTRVDIMAIFRELPSIAFSSLDSDDAVRIDSSAEDLLKRLSTASGDAGENYYLVTVARNLSVFAVGTYTQLSGHRAPPGYTSMSFDVPVDMQATLMLAQEQAMNSGGRLFCIMRSSDTKSGDRELSTVYKSSDLMRLITAK